MTDELFDHRGKLYASGTTARRLAGSVPVLSTAGGCQSLRPTRGARHEAIPLAISERGMIGDAQDAWRCATLCGYARRGENAWEV